MWIPKYTIENQLLRTIREIGEVLGEIRNHPMSKSNFTSLITEARALSTFASTSIEGNPLTLTDVKPLLKNTPGQLRDTEREIFNYNRALEWCKLKWKPILLNSELKRSKLSKEWSSRVAVVD